MLEYSPPPAATDATPVGEGSLRRPLSADVPMPNRFTSFDRVNSFHRFGLDKELLVGLHSSGAVTPTRTQEVCIPAIMEGQSVLVVAQTGSGKTMAYVLPILHRLLRSNPDNLYPLENKPRAVILVPTRELAIQVGVFWTLFGRDSIREVTSTGLAAGLSYVKEARALNQGRGDVVVCTPARLLLHLMKGNVKLGEVTHLVIDEADTLCDTFYEKEVADVISKTFKARGAARSAPLVAFVGATRTGAVSNFVRTSVPTHVVVNQVVAPDAHMTVPALEQVSWYTVEVFVPMGGRKRSNALVDTLEERQVRGQKTLIFTNTVARCRGVAKMLEAEGYSVSLLHGEMAFKNRRKEFASFKGASKTGTPAKEIMVCTNLASRGLDFDDVGHVIMYDFPYTLADYIHRVGRTARAGWKTITKKRKTLSLPGRAGRVTVLFRKKNLPVVRKIQEASRASRPLDVRFASKSINKILKLEKLKQDLETKKVKLKKRSAYDWYLARRKKMGLPPRDNLCGPAKRAVIQEWRKRYRMDKKLVELVSRGRLKKGEVLPKMPNHNVTRSDSQEQSVLKRDADTGSMLRVNVRRNERLLVKKGLLKPADDEEGHVEIRDVQVGDGIVLPKKERTKRENRMVF
ncbi:DEAD box ATP-dependent RNA helicase, putative [Perkinsus marinus ATCC 50983]|uniref:DEAD box ATP-dependent RNA helicase, putative n=1 Tax=Perkinsus marinus (strain ATCC 50983 / TXsc) TaxID=423536 RepID=C5LT32_PERM5|nr:DEAD box ATP-dependent RNA helicase, putative [Perkinsus marinus ATCC 50983]EEQ99999.1 DEAD box ATP-dependent RNA helicase, putative [Perkinsus marinus ATCC 50983]|eukprot:XP_002767282.1 DEAD box ATP-dependent RNA helicase, putative [Perkinsus marinus ATCC 50983]